MSVQIRSRPRVLVIAVLISIGVCPPALGQALRTRAPVTETSAQILAAANMDARQRPSRDGFNAARHDYTYRDGALYELITNPNFISTILLEPGESLVEIAAGDTSRWMVSQATTESEREERTIVLIKPQAANLRTNVVLLTDRRTYLIEAISQAGEAYAAQIAWSYPETELAYSAPRMEAIRDDYRIRAVRGRTPAWSPRRVYDDGARTWIDFPRVAGALDLPPLFVITAEGAEIVNYRVEAGAAGPRYEIDRIFDVAELRLGARSPTIVRIERISALPVRALRRAGPRP